MNFFVVEDSSGEILRSGSCAAQDLPLQAGAGETAIEGAAKDDTQYWLNSALSDRPDFPVVLSSYSVMVGMPVTFSSIPLGAKIIHPDGETTIDDPQDTDLTWSSMSKGIYEFSFESFPYQRKTFLVQVTFP